MECNLSRRADLYARNPEYVVSDYSDPSQGLVIFLIALAVVGIITCMIVKLSRRSSQGGCGLSGRRAAASGVQVQPGSVHECTSLKEMEEIIIASPKCVIMFMAPWCSHCKSTKGPYAEAAKTSGTPQLMMDCDAYMKDPEALKKHQIEGFPTIKKYKDGKPVSQYQGDRSAGDLSSYAKSDN